MTKALNPMCERYRLALRDIEDIAHRVANGSLNVPGREASIGELKYVMRSLRDKARKALDARREGAA